jgi:hypothetical protein
MAALRIMYTHKLIPDTILEWGYVMKGMYADLYILGLVTNSVIKAPIVQSSDILLPPMQSIMIRGRLGLIPRQYPPRM